MSRLSLSRKKLHSTTSPTQSTEEMSLCPRCGKPVYFAERKVILGKDWHSHCLRCDNCDKPLTPGQHSAHLDRPYCNACYQSMFGTPGFRQGHIEPRRVVVKGEGDMSAGKKQEVVSKIREYNLYKESPMDKIKSREINGYIHYEGVLKVYWGLKKPITLAPGVLYSKNRASRASILDFVGGVDDMAYLMMLDEAAKKRRTIYSSSGMKIMENAWDSKERMPVPAEEDVDMLSMSLPANLEGSTSLPGTLERRHKDNGNRRKISTDSTASDGVGSDDMDGNVSGKPLKRGTSVDSNSFNSRSPIRKRSASFKRISRAKKNEEKKELKRHQFTPPYGTPTNIRVTSGVSTKDVIIMLLAKFKVEDDPSGFGLCVVYDNGFQEPCKEDDYPLQLRLKLGPSEEIAKIFVMESSECKDIQISSEVAEWIKFSVRELEVFSKKFEEEEEKEQGKIKKRFSRWKEAVSVQLEAIKQGGGYHETDI